MAPKLAALLTLAALAAGDTSIALRGKMGRKLSPWESTPSPATTTGAPTLAPTLAPTSEKSEVGTQGWGDYFYGCKMGSISYNRRWWGWWPNGCHCWNNWQGQAFTGDDCSRTPNGLKIHDSYYGGGQQGYYLVEVPAAGIAKEMLTELYSAKNNGYLGKTGDAAAEQYWADRNVPTEMRGLWWTDYNNGLTSFLHNQPATTNAGKLESNTIVYGQNVWSWSTTTLYTVVDLLNLNYLFKLEDTDSDGKVDHADIIPRFNNAANSDGISVSQWLTAFTMKSYDKCPNCLANGPGAGNGGVDSAQSCPADQCWRRYTSTGGGDSVWEYDLIKIVDQHGNKIEPGFSNWRASLIAEGRSSLGGTDLSLLPKCMPDNPTCRGDNSPGVVGVQSRGG